MKVKFTPVTHIDGKKYVVRIQDRLFGKYNENGTYDIFIFNSSNDAYEYTKGLCSGADPYYSTIIEIEYFKEIELKNAILVDIYRDEFSNEQLAIMDAVDNSIMQLCNIMTDGKVEEWDASIIAPIVNMISSFLNKKGYKVHYPTKFIDEEGNERVSDSYIDENDNK